MDSIVVFAVKNLLGAHDRILIEENERTSEEKHFKNHFFSFLKAVFRRLSENRVNIALG